MTRAHHHGHGHHTDRRRSVRPRPINIDEKLRVVYLSKKKDAAGEPLDPNLIEWLKEQDAEQDRELKLQAAEKAAAAAAAAGGAIIHVPQVRPVQDYDHTIVPALQDQPRYSALDPTTAAYFRYQDMWVRQTVEQVVTAYDMEEEDVAWLEDVLPTKAAKHVGEASSEDQQAATLSAEQFEALIQRLELLHFELLKRHAPNFEKEIKMDKVPRIPATEKVLTRSAAVRNLCTEEGAHPAWLVEAVYDHWKSRRKQMGGPLLQHLWFEMPWKAKSFADPAEPTELGDMPFMVVETRNSRAGARLRVTDKEAWNILAGVREELEGLRTLADQVKKRERLKKQMLKNWRDQLRLGKGKTHKSRKAAGGKQSAQKPGSKAKAASKASKAVDAGVQKKAAGKASAGSSAAAAGSKQPVKKGSSIAAGILLPKGRALGQGSKLIQLGNNLKQKEQKQLPNKVQAKQQPLANGKLGGSHGPSRLRNVTDASKKPTVKQGAGQGAGSAAAAHAGPSRPAATTHAAQQPLHHAATTAAGRSPASPMTAALLVEQALLAAGAAHNKRALRELAGLRMDSPAPGAKAEAEEEPDVAEIAPYIALVSPPSSDNSADSGSDLGDDTSSGRDMGGGLDAGVGQGKGVRRGKGKASTSQQQPLQQQQQRVKKRWPAPGDAPRLTRAAACTGHKEQSTKQRAANISASPSPVQSPEGSLYSVSSGDESSGSDSDSEEDSQPQQPAGRRARAQPSHGHQRGRQRHGTVSESELSAQADGDGSTSDDSYSYSSGTSESSWQASEQEGEEEDASQHEVDEASVSNEEDNHRRGRRRQQQSQQALPQPSNRVGAGSKQPAGRVSRRAAGPSAEQENRHAVAVGERSTRGTQPLKPLNGEHAAHPVNGKKAQAFANGLLAQHRVSGASRPRGISDKELRALGLEVPAGRPAGARQSTEPDSQTSQPESSVRGRLKQEPNNRRSSVQLGVRNSGVTKPRAPRGISATELRALGLQPAQAPEAEGSESDKPTTQQQQQQQPRPQQATGQASKQHQQQSKQAVGQASKLTVRANSNANRKPRGISDKELKALGLPVPNHSKGSPAQARGAALVRASLDRARSAQANRTAATARTLALPGGATGGDGAVAASELQPASRKRAASLEPAPEQPARPSKARRTAGVSQPQAAAAQGPASSPSPSATTGNASNGLMGPGRKQQQARAAMTSEVSRKLKEHEAADKAVSQQQAQRPAQRSSRR